MKTKHTPGLWEFINDDPMDLDYTIYTGDFEDHHTIIADVFGSKTGTPGYIERKIPLTEEALANAKLIAAAPELLDALRSIDQRLKECWRMGGPISAHEAYDSFYQEIVQEAIKKATS